MPGLAAGDVFASSCATSSHLPLRWDRRPCPPKCMKASPARLFCQHTPATCAPLLYVCPAPTTPRLHRRRKLGDTRVPYILDISQRGPAFRRELAEPQTTAGADVSTAQTVENAHEESLWISVPRRKYSLRRRVQKRRLRLLRCFRTGPDKVARSGRDCNEDNTGTPASQRDARMP